MTRRGLRWIYQRANICPEHGPFILKKRREGGWKVINDGYDWKLGKCRVCGWS